MPGVPAASTTAAGSDKVISVRPPPTADAAATVAMCGKAPASSSIASSAVAATPGSPTEGSRRNQEPCAAAARPFASSPPPPSRTAAAGVACVAVGPVGRPAARRAHRKRRAHAPRGTAPHVHADCRADTCRQRSSTRQAWLEGVVIVPTAAAGGATHIGATNAAICTCRLVRRPQEKGDATGKKERAPRVKPPTRRGPRQTPLAPTETFGSDDVGDYCGEHRHSNPVCHNVHGEQGGRPKRQGGEEERRHGERGGGGCASGGVAGKCAGRAACA